MASSNLNKYLGEEGLNKLLELLSEKYNYILTQLGISSDTLDSSVSELEEYVLEIYNKTNNTGILVDLQETVSTINDNLEAFYNSIIPEENVEGSFDYNVYNDESIESDPLDDETES